MTAKNSLGQKRQSLLERFKGELKSGPVNSSTRSILGKLACAPVRVCHGGERAVLLPSVCIFRFAVSGGQRGAVIEQ